jgi:phosphatidylserine decarboxylase
MSLVEIAFGRPIGLGTRRRVARAVAKKGASSGLKTLGAVTGLASEYLWGSLRPARQLLVSRFVSRFYESSLSAWMIRPYCKFHYGDSQYSKRFKPGREAARYRNFQDFFMRELTNVPSVGNAAVWPCEGHLCDRGQVAEFPLVRVKGERRKISVVFGRDEESIPHDYHFSNVFLHNKHYHHIHAPISGRVSRVQHIPGELLLLRPWAYPGRPSVPALTNERINVDIEDRKGRTWMLSIVGGPLVATIILDALVHPGSIVQSGQKLASFALGSTCCMISPIPPGTEVGEEVYVGSPL